MLQPRGNRKRVYHRSGVQRRLVSTRTPLTWSRPQRTVHRALIPHFKRRGTCRQRTDLHLLTCFASETQGHAVHPSYPQKHERNHAPKLNGGVAIKTNARQSYTSEGVGTFIIKQLAATRNRVLQQYELPNDVRGGSTIGRTLLIPLM